MGRSSEGTQDAYPSINTHPTRHKRQCLYDHGQPTVPPLPVCGVRGSGSDQQEAIVSGHDLLSRAIACTLIDTLNRDKKHDGLVQERKYEILATMHKQIAAIWAEDADEQSRIERCYDEFGSSFRAYMRLYPGPDDVRILPLFMVDNEHVVCRQAVMHLQARKHVTVPGEPESGSDVCMGMRYHDLIRAYAIDLHNARL